MLACCAAFGVMRVILTRTGGEHTVLDSMVTLFGVTASVLALLSYMEYAALMTSGTVCSVILYVTMLADHPEQATYLIYALYALICSVIAIFRLKKLYAEQQSPQKKDM